MVGIKRKDGGIRCGMQVAALGVAAVEGGRAGAGQEVTLARHAWPIQERNVAYTRVYLSLSLSSTGAGTGSPNLSKVK